MDQLVTDMWIAVDAMGGDRAPAAIVEGAVSAARQDSTSILLVGDRGRIQSELDRLGGSVGSIEIVHADEVVGMDDGPTSALRKKRRSSLRLCANLVKEGRAEALVTAGNTGAAMVTAKVVLGMVRGVDRPALAAVFPSRSGRTVVLDVGANVDSKSAHLRQFAIMGHFYAQEVLKCDRPRVGLLSIGEEDSKGTGFTRQVLREMKSSGFNFVGNVEGRDVFDGTVEVVVCDGFVGNVLLKSTESVAELFADMLKEEFLSDWRTKVGGALAKPAFERFRTRTDYREYGAAPLLGLRGGCFVGHGRSDALAIHSAIRRAVEFSEGKVHEKIRDKIAELHQEEERLREESQPDSSGELSAEVATSPAVGSATSKS